MIPAHIEEQIRSRLAAHDVRLTKGRKRVLEALAAAEGPQSAAELHALIGQRLPLSSLYRSLAVLADAEVLAPHHGTKGITRYELAEWLAGHHHHLVCVSCGGVDDIQLPPELEGALETVVTGAARVGGFQPLGHALEIDGLCGGCE